jgi:site-specific DNA recombinase
MPALEAEVDFLKIEQLSSETVLHGAKDLYKNWKTLPFEQKRSIIEVITKDITIGKSTININLAYQPNPNTHLSQKSGKSPLANWRYWGRTL